MEKRQIVPPALLQIMLQRLCRQLIENHGSFPDSVLLGLQPRGTLLAGRLHRLLQEITGRNIPFGVLDTTFYRDDFRHSTTPLTANQTSVPFSIENKRVILIDDVLFTGRSVRAALDALNAFGRPAKVELLVLIDRAYSRDLPIEPTYTGKKVNSLATEKVRVIWAENQPEADSVWLFSSNA